MSVPGVVLHALFVGIICVLYRYIEGLLVLSRLGVWDLVFWVLDVAFRLGGGFGGFFRVWSFGLDIQQGRCVWAVSG